MHLPGCGTRGSRIVKTASKDVRATAMTDMPESRSLDAVSVLLVEDNVFMRELLKSVLRRLGVSDIREAIDGEDAFRVLYVHPVDIVICDIQMQPIDGITFLDMLRKGEA